jgi:hypothetical protein
MEEYCVWDPSLVRDGGGAYHLFFSRWPLDLGFRAWVTHSEVCRASAETPLGPFHFEEVVLEKRPGCWDGDVTHNPQIRRFEERYYLYYNGNRSADGWWDHRNNQRVGVAVADRPEGPWERFDQPLLDVTPGAWDCVLTTNPSCARTPDCRYILMYKAAGDGNPPPQYGPVLHGVAFADSPDGPFTRHPTPLFASGESDFPGEDPCVWCQGGRYYALLKDQGSFYADASRAIVLFESDDGLDWELSETPIVQERELTHEEGRIQPINRLERPFLYREEGGVEVFFCGVKPDQDRERSQVVGMRASTQTS